MTRVNWPVVGALVLNFACWAAILRGLALVLR